MEAIRATIKIRNSEKEDDAIIFPVMKEGFSLADLRGAFPSATSLRYIDGNSGEHHHVIVKDGLFQEPIGGWENDSRTYIAMCGTHNTDRNSQFAAFRRHIGNRLSLGGKSTTPNSQRENIRSQRPGKPEPETTMLHVGHGHFFNEKFKKISETNLSLAGGTVVIGPYTKTDDVTEQIKLDAFRKFCAQHQLFRRKYKSAEEFLLVYPDGSKIEKLPDNSEKFTLEAYRNFLDPKMRYDRIKIYICNKANYFDNNIEIVSDSSSSSEDLPTLANPQIPDSPTFVVECNVYLDGELIFRESFPNNAEVKTVVEFVEITLNIDNLVLQTSNGDVMEKEHRLKTYTKGRNFINIELVTERPFGSVKEESDENTNTSDIRVNGEYEDEQMPDTLIKHLLRKIGNAEEPTFVLNEYQKIFMQGRPLGVTSESETLEGETSQIYIRRAHAFEDSIYEVLYQQNLRFPLEVQFYGEGAMDLGGPRSEFFGEVLTFIKSSMLQAVEDEGKCTLVKKSNFIASKGYYVAGLLVGLSAIQNGPCADFLDVLMDESQWESDEEHVNMFKKGLRKTGLLQLLEAIPSVRYLFRRRDNFLTVPRIRSILVPKYSEEGSNRRVNEEQVYNVFSKYLREVAGGRRGNVTLEKVLKFVTGAEEEPVLGFNMKPSVDFAEIPGDFPTASTCIYKLTLPLSSDSNENLFKKFDLAFLNSYFGYE